MNFRETISDNDLDADH